MSTATNFGLFTTTRYDPILLSSKENGKLAYSRPCPIYMLVHHVNRVVEAAKHFGFQKILDHLQDGAAFQGRVVAEVEAYQKTANSGDAPLRVRITFKPTGEVNFDFGSAPPVTLEELYPTTFNLPEETQAARPMKVSPLTGGALERGNDDAQSGSMQGATSRVVTPIAATYSILIYPKPAEVTAHFSYKTTYRAHYDLARQCLTESSTAMPNLPDSEVLLFNPAGQAMECSVSTPYFFRNGRWVTPPLNLEHGGQMGTTRRWALLKDFCGEEDVLRGSIQAGERVWISNGLRGFHWGYVAATSQNGA